MTEQSEDKYNWLEHSALTLFLLLGIVAIVASLLTIQWLNRRLSSYDGIVTAVETSVVNNNCVVYFSNNTHTKAISGTVNVIVGDKYSIVVDGLGNIRSITLEK